MSHFGVLSHSGVGHINPLIALSRQLKARGHRVTFFQKPELKSGLLLQGLEFSSISRVRLTQKMNRSVNENTDTKSRLAILRDCLGHIVSEMEISLREMPVALAEAGIDVLIVDEIILSGPTLAQLLGIPYFVVSTSLPLNFGWSVLRRRSGYRVSTSLLSRLEDALLQVSVFRMRGPVRWRLNRFRRKYGLGPIQRLEIEFPALAHIAQLPECLDVPRSRLPDNFHYAGPFVDEAERPKVQFPWDHLDGRPMIYASLGTARTVEASVIRFVAKACHELNLQLVLTSGGRRVPEEFTNLPGRPLVVRDAPQLELLKRAEIVITHCGLNTVLETLIEGKPMLAIPIAYDQPAIADRLAWLGVAEVLPFKGLATRDVTMSLQKLLNDKRYRDAALVLQGRIRNACGLKRAADLIEAALERRMHRQAVPGD